MLLREYWKAITDRCTKLKLRNQTTILKKMNCQNMELIPEKRREDLIHTTIMIQEEKYVQNLKKFKQQVNASKDPKERICSRLLKMYTDNFVLNQRTYEQDIEIIKTQIDGCLPLIDPMKEAAEKKALQKALEKKAKKSGVVRSDKDASNKTSSRSAKSSMAEKEGKRSITSDQSVAQKGSMMAHFDQSELTVLRESVEDDEDEQSDSSDYNMDTRSPSKLSSIIKQESVCSNLEDISQRRAQKEKMFEERKKKREEQDFLNQLRQFALLTPSMEFIPEFKNFIKTMQ